MASTIDKFTVFALVLDEDEVNTIVSSLYDAGESDLATEIWVECFGDDVEGEE